ncbi:MAG: hypothetical protein H3C26_08600 [Rhodocyclaceae bacterium]|nr:hypothetical protein [Rhodocyclaceae bacterium]
MNKITLATIAILGAFGATNIAYAATTVICDSTSNSAAKNGTAPESGGASNFMVTAIQPKCSANVNLEGRDGANGSFYAVGANSAKGKSNFAGHTNGGAVAPLSQADGGVCTVPGGCTLAEATAAAGKATDAAAAAGGTGGSGSEESAPSE